MKEGMEWNGRNEGRNGIMNDVINTWNVSWWRVGVCLGGRVAGW